MHFGEITTNTPNVQKGMLAKYFGKKISSMMGKKQVSTYGI